MNNQKIQDLNIIQINLGRSKSRTYDLAKFATLNKSDILLIQEPFLFKEKIIGFPTAWKIFHANQHARSAIIIINSNLLCFPVELSMDICTIQIGINNNKWLISSIYMQYNTPNIDNYLFLIENNLGKFRHCNILLAGDFNAKNPIWGGDLLDNRGRQIEDFIASNNIIICNNRDSLPTFQRGDTRSWIDITLTDNRNFNKILDWTVHDDFFEDHKMITFRISQQPISLYHKTRYKHKYCKTKLLKTLATELTPWEIELSQCNSEDELNRIYPQIELQLKSICEKVYKKKKTFQNYNNSWNWWTSELEIKKKQVRAARKRWQRAINNNKTQKLI